MNMDKYKICPECGTHNPPGLLECRECEADLTGVKVTDAAAEQNQERSEAESKQVTMSEELVRICDCGTENASQARKCKSYGEDISDIIPVTVRKSNSTEILYRLTTVDGSFSAAIDRDTMIIGRESGLNDYLKSKVYVSRQHASLTVVDEKVFIENLGRTNKTFVNNEEIPDNTPVQLNNGDEIGLGGKVIEGKRQDNAAYFIISLGS